MDIYDIFKKLPHRFPFLLVDKILEMDENHVIAVKNVTYNEPYFQGHFPGQPVMPGVLVIEATAQAAGFLIYLTTGDTGLFYFAGLDNVRFKRIVEPGDQLFMHITVEKQRKNFWKFNGEAKVDGQLACTADILIGR